MGSIFHLAFPVFSIEETRNFYIKKLGLKEGRASSNALIITLENHQLVAHRVDEMPEEPRGIYPRHFGLIFDTLAEWESWLVHCQKANVEFFQQPKLRYEGMITEHRTFFLRDPSNNLLEFKYYSHRTAIYDPVNVTQIGDEK